MCIILYLQFMVWLVKIYQYIKYQLKRTLPIIKGGLINFTKQMASYYSKKGIRINNICPGGVFDKKK